MKFKHLFHLFIALFVLSSCQKVPDAIIGSNKSVAETGEEIYFENESINGHRFEWNFGDGTVSTEKFPVKAFDKAGSFQVKLQAFNKDNSKESNAFMNVVIKNSSDKFIGFYDATICDADGLVQISPGPSANEVFVEFNGNLLSASVSGNAIILGRKEVTDDNVKLAYSGSGNIAGDVFTLMLKIEFYDEDSNMWFPYYCSISGKRK
jgi:hypothetical protein